MKQKRRTKSLLTLALLLVFVLGLVGASQITSVSVAGTKPEATLTLSPQRLSEPRMTSIVGEWGKFTSPVALLTEPVEVLSGDNNYFLKINLRDSRVRVRVALANNDTGGLQSLSGIKNRFENQGYAEWAIVNGDLFSPRDGIPPDCPDGVNCAQGLTYIDGTHRPNWSEYGETWRGRGNIGFDSSSNVEIARGDDQSKRHMVISGGPRVLMGGGSPTCQGEYNTSWSIAACGPNKTWFPASNECFDDNATGWCIRTDEITMLGYSADGQYLYMGVSRGGKTVTQLAQWLKDRGAHEILRLDSGGSTGMYHNGTLIESSDSNRAIANAFALIVESGPPPTPPPGDGIELCTDPNYGGHCYTYTHIDDGHCFDLRDQGLNNNVSSFRFHGDYVGNYTLILYDDEGSCTGGVGRFEEDNSDLSQNTDWNDRASSMRIERRQSPPECPQSGGVILYKHANYDCGGEGEGSGYVRRDSTGWQNVPGSFNDQASSVRVPSGWSVKLYKHSDRGEPSTCRSSDDSDFAGDTFNDDSSLNDEISSFEVFDQPGCAMPPPAPALSSPPNGHTFVSCANITLDWNESSGASEYYAELDTDPNFSPPINNSGWRSNTDWNVGTLLPDTYYWHAKARNEYLVESDWSDTWSFTVNPNQSPNTPSPQSPDDGVWVNSRTITLQWQDNGDPDNCPRDYRTYNVEIWRSGWSDNVSDHSGTSWQVTVPSDDDYQWHVQAYDGDLTSPWSGDRTVKVDATRPDTTITDCPQGDIPVGDVCFSWTGSDNRTPTGDLRYSYRLRGLSDNWLDWSGDTNVCYSGLPDGDYTFEVKARDLAENEDDSPASCGFGVDTTPPDTTITSGPSGCIGTADVTFTWTGSDNRTPTAELLYSYKLEGFDANWSAWAGATSKSYTGLPDGDYTFKVKAKDGVGYEDPSPATRSFRVDTTPPTGSVLINGGDSTTNKIAVRLDITGNDGPIGCGVTEMRLSNDGFNWEAWQPSATEGEWLLPTLNRTTWTVHLQLKDLVGNTSESFTDDIYLDLYPLRPASENYQLGARVAAAGDGAPASASYELFSATAGQTLASGGAQGGLYRLQSGFQGAWPSVPRGRPPAESYDINPSVMASSGGYQASESYWLWGTTGQPADHNQPSSENYHLLSGYRGIQPLPCKLLGDLDTDRDVDVADIMQVASRWRCRSGDDCYHERYDLDKDDDIDIVDIMLVAVHWGETC